MVSRKWTLDLCRSHTVQIIAIALLLLLALLGAVSVLTFPYNGISGSHLSRVPRTKLLAIVVYFTTNCIAHAATVLLPSGATLGEIMVCLSISVMNPYYGAGRALVYLVQYFECSSDDLHMALARNNVFVIARTKEWQPTFYDDSTRWDVVTVYPSVLNEATQVSNEPQHSIDRSTPIPTARFELIEDSLGRHGVHRPVSLDGRRYHGHLRLPTSGSYETIALPLSVTIQMVKAELEPTDDIYLAYKGNPFQCLISLGQLVYTSISVYQTRGDQVRDYGIAAYGFLVVPYALMSLLNLVALLFVRDFPSLYLLNSHILQEALRRPEVRAEGAIGNLRAQAQRVPRDSRVLHMRMVHGQGRAVDTTTASPKAPSDFLEVSCPGTDEPIQRYTLDSQSTTVFRISRYTDFQIRYLLPKCNVAHQWGLPLDEIVDDDRPQSDIENEMKKAAKQIRCWSRWLGSPFGYSGIPLYGLLTWLVILCMILGPVMLSLGINYFSPSRLKGDIGTHAEITRWTTFVFLWFMVNFIGIGVSAFLNLAHGRLDTLGTPTWVVGGLSLVSTGFACSAAVQMMLRDDGFPPACSTN